MLTLTLALLACSNPEEVLEGDISGKLIIPKAAATRTVVAAVDDDGDGTYSYAQSEITDVRLLGPVYVGAFSGIDTVSFPFAYPSMGPVIDTETRGDLYPYGGTTIGRFDFACYEAVACKVTTGRFKDYDDVLDHFRNNLGTPITDSYGDEIETGETFRDRCYDYFSVTSDAELSFIAGDELDFEEDGEDFVAEFTLNHTIRVDGMAVWAYMDSPVLETDTVAINGAYTTCDPSGGNYVEDYVATFTEGRSAYDVLNQPVTYLSYGDWISDGKTTVSFDEDLNVTNDVVVNLNYKYEEP